MYFPRDFFRKHTRLFWAWIVASIAFVSLPQWLDAILSLVERTSGSELTIPAWAFAITVPVGLGMGIIAVWAVRDKTLREVAPEVAKSENLTDSPDESYELRLVHSEGFYDGGGVEIGEYMVVIERQD